MICPKCGSNVSDGVKFCGECGFSIAAQGTPAAQFAPQQQPGWQQSSVGRSPMGHPGMQYGQPVAVPAGAGAPTKGGSKLPIIIVGAVALIVVVGVVVAGVLTGWFGLADSGNHYAVAKVTSYDDKGTKVSVTEYSRDENGNAKSYTTKRFDEDGDITSTVDYVNRFDDNGYIKKSFYTTTSKDGAMLADYSNEASFDIGPDGKAKSSEYENELKNFSSGGGDTPSSVSKNKGTRTIEYHQNGRIKSASSEYTYEVKGSGSNSYTSERTSSSEYDENGRVLHSDWTDSNYQGKGKEAEGSTDYTWEFDKEGKPTGVTVETSNSTIDEDKTIEYTFDTDEAGNVTAIYEDGKKIREYEYEHVDNPSTNIRYNHTFNPY